VTIFLKSGKVREYLAFSSESVSLIPPLSLSLSLSAHVAPIFGMLLKQLGTAAPAVAPHAIAVPVSTRVAAPTTAVVTPGDWVPDIGERVRCQAGGRWMTGAVCRSSATSDLIRIELDR
jgi:hypothetical protein